MTTSQKNKGDSPDSQALPQRILVVDDDEGMGLLIRASLPASCQIDHVTSGSQATIAAAALRTELILLDLHMPNITGYEALRQIRQHPRTSGIPVICMTSDLDDSSRGRAFELGALGSFQASRCRVPIVGS